MSLLVKFPYGRSQGALLICSDCSFSTRNRVLFDRHSKHCKKNSTNEEGSKLPAPRVSRNYFCERCGLASNQSRQFLLHLKTTHNERFQIYVCNTCEYASKHKNKVFRHRRQVHKHPLPIDDIASLDDNGGILTPLKEHLYHTADDDSEILFKLNEEEKSEAKKGKKQDVNGIAWKQGPGGVQLALCRTCGFSNSVRWKVAQHIKVKHQQRQIYKCSQCSFKTDKKVEWCLHKTKHNQRQLLECGECGYKTGVRRNMQRHRSRHDTLYAPYKCPLCSYASTSEIVIMRHKAQYHKDGDQEKPRRPQTARKSIPVKRPRPSDGGDVTCEECGASFSCGAELHRHTMMSHTVACPVCHIKFRRSKELYEHIEDRHGSDQQNQALDFSLKKEQETSEEEGPLDLSATADYPCPYCDYTAKTADEMQSHLCEHKICMYCGLNYSTQEELDDHLENYHRVSTKHHGLDVGSVVTQTEHKCQSCGHTANSKSELQRHVASHGRDKSYHCMCCEYTSQWKGDMRKHLQRKHLDEVEQFGDLKEMVEQTYQPANSNDSAMASLTAFVDEVEENNNISPAKTMESCYLGGSWELSPVKGGGEEGGQEREDESRVRVKCPVCSGDYHPAALKQHMQKHSNLRRYQCVTCGRRSNWVYDIRKHIKEAHEGVDPIAGVLELSEEEARESLQGYLDATYPNGVPEKKPSPKVTTPRIERAVDKASKKGMFRKFKCAACGKRSNWRWDLNKHIRSTHGTAEVIEMTDEEAMNTFHEVFLRGGNIRGSTTPKAVKQEEKKEEKKEKKKEEEEEKKEEDWTIQQGTFYGKQKTAKKTSKTVESTKMRSFRCSQCQYQSKFRTAVIRHKRIKHPGMPARVVIVDQSSGGSRWKCCKCTFTSAVKVLLLDHMRRCTPDSVVFSCKICGRRHKYRASCFRHVKTVHKKVKKVQRFIVEPNLLKTNDAGQSYMYLHLKNHVPDPSKPFKCKYCPYYLNANRLLRQHEKTHEKDSHSPLKITLTRQPSADEKKRFLCDKCPTVTFSANAFMYHKQLHRPRQGRLKCPQCACWLTSKKSLASHAQCHSQAYLMQHRPEMLASSSKQDLPQLPAALGSPFKSVYSSEYAVDDAVEMARLKRQVIASRVASVPVTPCKINDTTNSDLPTSAFMPGVVIGNQGRILSSGPFRKMHKCRFCPYSNVRLACLHMHEKMHEKREKGDKEVFHCHHCSYSVGNKGLLNMHMRVHAQQYVPGVDQVNDIEKEEGAEDDEVEEDVVLPEKQVYSRDLTSQFDMEKLPQKTDYYIKYNDKTEEHVLERAIYKKWCCEKCPYATMKKGQFEKHCLLHGSSQKYACEFCDYSVPGYHLLLQHQKLHLSPNPNLLSVQSISNLHRLPTIPADVAAAANFDPEYGGQPEPIKEVPQLYENSSEFEEPKKQFRCDRCPYSNARRDMLLSHLKFHLLKSELKCQFCDYSVSKQHLLNQHMKIHFNLPGSDMNPEPATSVPLPQLDIAEDEAADLRAAYANEAYANEECRFCGREFTDPHQLKKHVDQHMTSVPSSTK
ncbi:hypothetical protein CAPTEDRAFT_227359 [Capitella teleta]|uniref:C2H2-type domain-containing protein n=1 Tax=Capitella teleta TaxID=283909 RepID=R7TRT6_CAPTE|nr:hypothetical protein CAPTEDRAFT_227359 [Capitella teleta]|eukprot:ELT93745.1 hypothetical protein CAPTEDRAFT_227359 [Capitella teleta]